MAIPQSCWVHLSCLCWEPGCPVGWHVWQICVAQSLLFSLAGAQNQDQCVLVGGTETWIWLFHFYFQLPAGPHLPSSLLLC